MGQPGVPEGEATKKLLFTCSDPQFPVLLCLLPQLLSFRPQLTLPHAGHSFDMIWNKISLFYLFLRESLKSSQVKVTLNLHIKDCLFWFSHILQNFFVLQSSFRGGGGYFFPLLLKFWPRKTVKISFLLSLSLILQNKWTSATLILLYKLRLC